MPIFVDSTQNFITVDPTNNSVEISLVNVETLYDFVTPALIDVEHKEVG